MNEYQLAMMDAPSLAPGHCVVCRRAHCMGFLTRHHVVPRSQGGAKGPTLHLCGHGTIGCHGLAEGVSKYRKNDPNDVRLYRLYFRYTDRWEYLEVAKPYVKYETALESSGWEPCHGR